MNFPKEHKKLRRLVEAHGLVYSKGSSHFRIEDAEGRFVATVSHSPSCMHFASNVVRDLVRRGYLPDTVKGTKF